MPRDRWAGARKLAGPRWSHPTNLCNFTRLTKPQRQPLWDGLPIRLTKPQRQRLWDGLPIRLTKPQRQRPSTNCSIWTRSASTLLGRFACPPRWPCGGRCCRSPASKGRSMWPARTRPIARPSGPSSGVCGRRSVPGRPSPPRSAGPWTAFSAATWRYPLPSRACGCGSIRRPRPIAKGRWASATSCCTRPSSPGVRHPPRSGRKETVVRLRVDGVLEQLCTLPAAIHGGVISRLKVQSGLDIAEKRAPQDGRFTHSFGPTNQKIDIRVATLPTQVRRADDLAAAGPANRVADPGAAGHEPSRSGGASRRPSPSRTA